jgi:hypothetical protein
VPVAAPFQNLATWAKIETPSGPLVFPAIRAARVRAFFALVFDNLVMRNGPPSCVTAPRNGRLYLHSSSGAAMKTCLTSNEVWR